MDVKTSDKPISMYKGTCMGARAMVIGLAKVVHMLNRHRPEKQISMVSSPCHSMSVIACRENDYRRQAALAPKPEITLRSVCQ
jgi:hypothetical protein